MNHRIESRKKSALERAEERAKLTDEEQLARLDKLLGKDIGAKKERAKLLQRISARKTKATKAEVKNTTGPVTSHEQAQTPATVKKGKHKNA